MIVLLPEQIRAGRGLINWSARKLAEAAKVGLSTVQRFEGGGAITIANLDAMRRALEGGGVEFISQNGGGIGVRLRPRVNVKVAGKVVGYALPFPKGTFEPPENPAQKQTRVTVEGREIGLDWAYQEVVAIWFASVDDARTWPGIELIE